MPNFKKIISAACAFAMSASLAVPALASQDLFDLASEGGYNYYTETFDSLENHASTSSIVNLSSASYTGYKRSNGLAFGCRLRTDGGGDSCSVRAVTDASRGKYLYFYADNYNTGDVTPPWMELTWMDAEDAAISNQLYLNFDINFQNTNTILSITDGSATIELSTALSSKMAVKTWYNITIASYFADKMYTIIIKDADGNFVDMFSATGTLTTVNKMQVNKGVVGVYLDNLILSDAIVPMITLDDVQRVRNGESTEIANITNTTDVSVELDNDAYFGYDYDAATGSLNLVANENALGETVNLTIEAVADKTISLTRTYIANTDDGFADQIANDIDLVALNTNIVVQESGYDQPSAKNNFTVPVTDGDGVIKWESSNPDIIRISGTGTATVNFPDDYTVVTLTATATYNKAKTVREIPIGVISANSYLEALAPSLDIVRSSSDTDYAYDDSNLTYDKTTTTYKAVGDFTVPVTLDKATITWSSSDANALEVDATGQGYVYPSKDGTVTLTALLETGTGSTTKDFVLDISDYYSEYKAAVDQAVEETKYLYYTSDTSCNDIRTPAENGALIFNDLYFPPTVKTQFITDDDETKTYTINVDWTMTESDYINSDGTLNVKDMDAHDGITITKTLKYVKNGKDVITAPTETYSNLTVQFKPDETLEATVTKMVEEAYPIDEATATRKELSEAARAEALKKYLKACIYDYQVKYDRAYEANFSGIPSSASKSDTFSVNTKGYFGSDISWSASSSYISVNNSEGTAEVVTQPSTTTNVTLTATVAAGTAVSSSNYTTKVKVTGKSSSSGSAGGGSSSGGSTHSTTTSTISSTNAAPIDVQTNTSTTLNPNPSGFTDLDSVDWALTAINNLYVNGVINGKNGTLFCPNDSVTRAEFAKMLVLAFDFETVQTDTQTFWDVPTSGWASEYVEAAYKNGIIAGFEDGSFDPDANITRQDMAVMVQRAATAAGYSFADKSAASTFSDADIIASYANDAVTTLQKANVLNGLGDGSFGPLNTSTRAQACQIIYNVFNK